MALRMCSIDLGPECVLKVRTPFSPPQRSFVCLPDALSTRPVNKYNKLEDNRCARDVDMIAHSVVIVLWFVSRVHSDREQLIRELSSTTNASIDLWLLGYTRHPSFGTNYY